MPILDKHSLAVWLPYEMGERALHGEHVEVSLIYALACLVTVFLMVLLIRKSRRDKRQRNRKKEK